MNDKDNLTKEKKINEETKIKTNKQKSTYVYRSKYLTGEDIDMLRDNNRTTKKRNVCDYHQDGA